MADATPPVRKLSTGRRRRAALPRRTESRSGYITRIPEQLTAREGGRSTREGRRMSGDARRMSGDPRRMSGDAPPGIRRPRPRWRSRTRRDVRCSGFAARIPEQLTAREGGDGRRATATGHGRRASGDGRRVDGPRAAGNGRRTPGIRRPRPRWHSRTRRDVRCSGFAARIPEQLTARRGGTADSWPGAPQTGAGHGRHARTRVRVRVRARTHGRGYWHARAPPTAAPIGSATRSSPRCRRTAPAPTATAPGRYRAARRTPR
jgi:hypothetical protein